MENTNKKTIYQQMVEVLPTEKISNWQSDLYVEVNVKSKEIVDNYKFTNNVTTFISAIEKTPWYCIPFAYDPWWEKRINKK
jgi:hypothetical protein